jgi:hypothetical protein
MAKSTRFFKNLNKFSHQAKEEKKQQQKTRTVAAREALKK